MNINRQVLMYAVGHDLDWYLIFFSRYYDHLLLFSLK